MKHIGDVIRHLSIQRSTNTDAISINEDTVSCPICRDAGFLRRDVPIGHPSFGKLYPCACTVTRREERDRDQILKMSNLLTFEEWTFDRFDPEVDGVREAYEAARRFAQDPNGWLFLHGRCGCGKTHLAAAIANEALKRNESVLFSVVPDLLDHLRATFDPAAGVAYDDRFNAIRGATLLILDDLGTENTTPWAREKLFQIFNFRYNERLPTVITSNQDAKRIEERVYSRICDTRLSRYVVIDAADHRRHREPGHQSADRS